LEAIPNPVTPAPLPERPLVDIEDLREFLDSISSFAGPGLILESKSVPRLYHYTDLAGLNGIVSNNDLWLTHVRFCNDDEELTHGQKVVAQTLAAEKNKAIPAEQHAYLEQVEELVNKPVPDGVYICCFCAKDNLLSQWRGYAANGVGVSIELNHEEFEYLTGPDCSHGLLRLWKVFYKEDQQRHIVSKALEFAWTMQAHLPMEKRVQNAADAIQFFIPTFKNSDFEEENEWRLIFTPRPNVAVPPQFRTARNMLVPYYTLQKLGWSPMKPLPITGLCIGPSTHKHLNAQSAQLLLKLRNYPDFLVEVSETPFRG
jgi:hypothetical protein